MANIIHYRNKCIGCGICYEMQPALWRMSKKDGKAVLLNAEQKKAVHVLSVGQVQYFETAAVAEACPVNIIKLS
jgi:ferredoxin